MKDEEAKYAQESGDDVNQHKQLLRDLEMRLQSTESMAERYEQKCTESQKTINSLKMGIQSIFHRIGCNTSAMSEMLADSNVTEANMMQYLGSIEQRTNEILQQYAAIQQVKSPHKTDDSAITGEAVPPASTSQAMLNILGMGPPTPMGQELIQVDPPNLEDYSSEDESDEEDDDARPLTRDELKAKTLKGIHRRANRESTKGGAGKRKKGR